MNDENDENERGSVIDQDILNPSLDGLSNDALAGRVAAVRASQDDGGVPSFLRRDENNQPVFTTQVDDDGQTELVVEGEGCGEPQGELSSDDVAMSVLDQLEDQITSQGSEHEPVGSAEGADKGEYQEAQVPAALAELERAVQEEAAHSPEPDEQPLPPADHNQPADPEEMRRDFFKDINKFGKASGEGASALGRLGLRCLRAAADGLISTAKPAKGLKDDATLIYEAYTAMDSKHSEHTAGGAKANASKLRQVIAMGCMTMLSDPIAIGNRVVRLHEQMTDQELKPKALFAGLVDVARAQQASDTELTDDAIQECLTKTKADKTLEKEWEAIHKRTEALITGEGSHGLKDTSDAAHKICELISEHVKQYKFDGTRQERIDDMIKLGYTREQAINIVDMKLDM